MKYDALVLLGVELGEDDRPTEELEARVRQAAEVWKRLGQNCGQLVLCGGVLPGHGISEAEVMAEMFEKQGISRENVLLDKASQDTMGNMRCAAALLGGTAGKHILIVTSDYHVSRAVRTARRIGFQAEGMPAKLSIARKKRLKLSMMEVCYRLDLFLGWQDEGKSRPAFLRPLFDLVFRNA